jgi:hypothetical protein
MIIRRILNSIAFRSSIIYSKILKLNKPTYKGFEKEKTDNYHIVILCGQQQIPLLQELLFSIISNFIILPSIYIFTDNGVNQSILSKKLDWISEDLIQVISHEDCINFHKDKGNFKIAEFAAKNTMGLKLAAIHQLADKGTPLLYCDTDVLWFKDPGGLITNIMNNKEIYTIMSQDFQPAYDMNLVQDLGLEILMHSPFYCAGISFFKLFLKKDLHKLEEMLTSAIVNSNHFTEQTIFAYFNKLNGDKGFEDSKFSIDLTDQFELFPQKKIDLIARHYVGAVRHQFWRDSFYMRCNYFNSKNKIE